MKKNYIKYLAIISLLIIMFCGYKYSKPKIFLTKKNVEKNIPLKINIYDANGSFGDSIILYLPYKFQVQNNRLRKIGVSDMYFSQMKDLYINEYVLFFDENGNPFGDFWSTTKKREILDNLLREKKFLQYFELKNIGSIFPFSNKSVYYYKSYKLSNKIFNKKITRQEYIDIAENFRNKEVKNLYAKAQLSIPAKIIDSLYKSDRKQNLFFIFKKQTKKRFGNYRVKFKLSNNKQNFTDNYDAIENMNRKELYEYMSKPVYEE